MSDNIFQSSLFKETLKRFMIKSLEHYSAVVENFLDKKYLQNNFSNFNMDNEIKKPTDYEISLYRDFYAINDYFLRYVFLSLANLHLSKKLSNSYFSIEQKTNNLSEFKIRNNDTGETYDFKLQILTNDLDKQPLSLNINKREDKNILLFSIQESYSELSNLLLPILSPLYSSVFDYEIKAYKCKIYAEDYNKIEDDYISPPKINNDFSNTLFDDNPNISLNDFLTKTLENIFETEQLDINVKNFFTSIQNPKLKTQIDFNIEKSSLEEFNCKVFNFLKNNHEIRLSSKNNKFNP